MKVKEIMTSNPTCCTAETSLQELAVMLIEHDCGAIPIVACEGDRMPIGIVTDRDIACRAIAAGKNALELSAGDILSAPCVTVTSESSLEECCEAMEKNQVRRVVVVDEAGRCCGVVSQADIARKGKAMKAAEVVKEISRPTSSASAVAH